MLVAHGWAVLHSSRNKFINADPEDLMLFDEETDANDEQLRQEFRAWMKTQAP